ncbi:MAG: hypothetical protein Q7U53_05515 [Anaerolineaceae bacterium]|nr:hypothetical protein [Anaerolineaceae bacterium]
MNKQIKTASSKEKSKKEHFLQIYLPLSFFLLLVVVASVFVIQISESGIQTVSHWANISVVLIFVPLLFTVLLILAILILIIFGQAKFIKWIPINVSKIYVFILKIALFIVNGSNKITNPIIKSKARIYSLKSIWKNERIK